MPEVAVPSGVEVVTVQQQPNSDACLNVLHYTGSGDFILEADANDIADAIHTAWAAHMQAVTAGGSFFRYVLVKDMSSVPWITYRFDYDTEGASAGSALPEQLALCVSLRTAVGGRRGRGRIFLGGPFTETENVAGVPTTAFKTAAAAYAADIGSITAASAAEFTLSVWSRLSAQLNTVIAATIDPRWDVQRRRANRRLA